MRGVAGWSMVFVNDVIIIGGKKNCRKKKKMERKKMKRKNVFLVLFNFLLFCFSFIFPFFSLFFFSLFFSFFLCFASFLHGLWIGWEKGKKFLKLGVFTMMKCKEKEI